MRAERRDVGCIDLDVVIACSSGTYIRSLARDLGADLGVGGHLTALRRTRVGAFNIADAVDATEMVDARPLTPAAAAQQILPVINVDADEARDLRHGKRLLGQATRLEGALVAAIDPEGTLVGIVEKRGADVKSAMNMPEDAS